MRTTQKVTLLTPPCAHAVLPFLCDSPMLMTFSRSLGVLRPLMGFGAHSWSSAHAHEVRFRHRDVNSVPGSHLRNAKYSAPDDHERQPKNEFWTIVKKKLTGRKVLVSSMSDNFFSVVGACLEVLEGCEGWFSRFFILVLVPNRPVLGRLW
jgi:hypothetical protein